jgi:tetratricopeptide (TPR) repeat protein
VGSPPSIDELVATPSPSGLRERFDAARGALLASLRSGWARTDRQGEAYVKLALDAVRARPTNPYYLWAAGPSDEHLERLTSRAERVQKDPRLWLAVGLREAQRGRADRAIRSLRRTLDLGLEDPDALYNLGLLITARDPQSSEGSQHLRRLIAIDPGSARSREAERLLEGRSR